MEPTPTTRGTPITLPRLPTTLGDGSDSGPTLRRVHALLAALDPAVDPVVVAAPGTGPGCWAGAPYAAPAGSRIALAYRLRRPQSAVPGTVGRGFANVVALWADGLGVEEVARLDAADLGAASLERPALVRRPDGGWRLYASCATPGSKHWWVAAMDADGLSGLPVGRPRVVLAGDDASAWKDVVVHADAPGRWRMWACRHPLDGGDDAADRMSTHYLTSSDGLAWTDHGRALTPTPGSWDARGTRVGWVHADPEGTWWALYDGRASAAENFHERTGLARGRHPGRLRAVAGPVPAAYGSALRYASVVAVPGGRRVFYEAGSADGSHALHTAYLPG